METGLGIARSPEGALAGELAARRALDDVPKPDLLLVFSSTDLDQPAVRKGIRKAAGAVPTFGFSTYAEITNLGQTQGTVVVLAMTAPELEMLQARAGLKDDAKEFAASKLAPFLAGAGADPRLPATALMGSVDFDCHVQCFLNAFRDVLPVPLPVTGGGAARREGPGILDSPGYLFGPEGVSKDELGLLLLKARRPDAVRFGYAYTACWQPLAHPVVCTRASENVVHEVDDIPILDYLKNYLGPRFQDKLRATGSKYTFIESLKDRDGVHYAVRSPLWRQTALWNHSVQGIPFFPFQDMAGSTIQLVQATRTELAESTAAAAQRAKDALGGYHPRVVLAFSCELRRQFLHSRHDEEVRRIQTVFGDEVPIVGAYAGGEYSPIYNSWSDVVDREKRLAGSCQLSTSLTILAIGTPEPPRSRGKLLPGLRQALSTDRQRENPGEPSRQRIEDLVKLLTQAEAMTDETEIALKRINREHFTLAEALRQKNEELAIAQRKNQRLQRLVRQYTPHKVWRKALASVDAGYYSIPNEETQLALLFLDVKGFTGFAETHKPEEVIRELNHLFEPATAIIYDHGGDVDKFIGDCIFATFASASTAVESALEMMSLARVIHSEGSPFSVRIGINLGRVVSGNVGGSLRRDHTLIGDAVNLAQRLESNCTPGAVLVSKPVWLAVKGELPPDVTITRREVIAKGKEKPVEAYELGLGERPISIDDPEG